MVDINYENWEPVIGLEIHVQLNTKTKLFGEERCSFGSEPNTDIGVVCTGQPGALPVLNREAVRKAVQFGCAIHASIASVSKFDRKSYFYPDSPKNFQITQFDQPIITGGVITCEVEGQIKHFKVNRAHIEEDSGMLKHFTNFSGIDYNRAGTSLLEIVSEPCLHSPKDAVSYAMSVKAIMEYIDASDCNMDEGSLRIDVNVSVRQKNEQTLRHKVEIKNMNSFSYMSIAIEEEIRRQIKFYTAHPHEKIEKGTYRFDPETKSLILMRTKENAEDYGYIPEPDIPPIILTQAFIDDIRSALPELPYARYKRYLSALQLPVQFAEVLVGSKKLSDYFEEALAITPHPRSLANWITVEFAGRLKESGQMLWDLPIPPSHIAELVTLIEQGTITGKIAKSVADDMVLSPAKSPTALVKANPDYQPVNDSQVIETLIDQVLAENAQSITDYKAGKTKAFAFLVGQVMKLCKGKASPALVNEILTKKLL
jgi:aspartyl-tRNA(Asn)/glutamyl-tRNA(Gln) amidotransferase subunit B